MTIDEMNIIFGCEESQACCIAFRELGHKAYSCDLKPCSGGHPEWHIQEDIMNVIRGGRFITEAGTIVEIKLWDMAVFFPDCTFLTISANKWYKEQPPRESGTLVGYERYKARVNAIKFFLDLYHCGIEKVAIENPIGIMSSVFRSPDQVLQPWMFGHGETKATCLWLKNLPKLEWANEDSLFYERTSVDGREQRIHELPKTKDRAEIRSKTFPNIAKAMADAWG